MFITKIIDESQSGIVGFENEPLLIDNKMKYRTLGEIVALARATGETPLPTRNGVYTGDFSVARDNFDRIDQRNASMADFEDAESKLSDAKSKLDEEERVREREAFEESIKQKYSKAE